MFCLFTRTCALGVLVCLGAVLPACRLFEPEPLKPERLLEESLARRDSWPDGTLSPVPGNLGFDASWSAGSALMARYLARLTSHNPHLQEARTAYESAGRKALAGAPWDDLEFGITPSFPLQGDDRAGGAAGVTLTLPWGGRRGRTRDLLTAEVSAAYQDYQAHAKTRAFALRSAFVNALVSAQDVSVATESHGLAKKGVELSQRIARAGGAAAVDVHLLEAEERAARLALLAAEDRLDADREILAALLHVSPGKLPPLPKVTAQPPPAGVLKAGALAALLPKTSMELNRLEAAFRVAVRAYAVERASGIPDLSIGIEVESDPGFDEHTVSVPLGISLPFWNANTEGMSEARAAVMRARSAYRTALDQALSETLHTLSRLGRLERRLAILDQEILPAHRRALAEAAKALEVSDFQALQYVEMERTLRQLQSDRNELLREVLTTRVDLEKTVGRPLFPLP